MKKKLILTVLILSLLCLFFSGCNPVSEKTARKRLKNMLTVDFTLKHKSETDDEHVYTYVDEDGIEFQYISSMHTVGMDGADFFSLEQGYTDYPECVIRHHESELLALCEQHGLRYEYDIECYDDIIIYADCKADTKTAASLMHDLFTVVGNIHMKSDLSGNFPIPQVCVRYTDDRCTDVCFPFEDDEIPSVELLHDDIMYDYTESVRTGSVANDLTQSELSKIPAQKLFISYNGTEYDYHFFHVRDENIYLMEFYDLVPSDDNYLGLTSFSEMCGDLGFNFQEHDKKHVWTVNGHQFSAEYDPKAESAVISRDGTKITEVEVYYKDEPKNDRGTYLCSVTPEQLALMLDSTCKTDNAKGRLILTSTAEV